MGVEMEVTDYRPGELWSGEANLTRLYGYICSIESHKLSRRLPSV